MSASCSSCGALLEEGVLRCRFCGADARAAAPSEKTGRTFSIAEVAPNAVRFAELIEELGTIAPDVLAWWRRAPRERKTRVFEILSELRELLRRG